jgi:hypothetical protein
MLRSGKPGMWHEMKGRCVREKKIPSTQKEKVGIRLKYRVKAFIEVNYTKYLYNKRFL